MSKARNNTFNISVGVGATSLLWGAATMLPLSPEVKAVVAQTADTMSYAGAASLVTGMGSVFLPDGPNWPVVPDPSISTIGKSFAAAVVLSVGLAATNLRSAPETPPKPATISAIPGARFQ